MKHVWLLSLIALLLACSRIPKVPAITRIPGDRREFNLLKRDYSALDSTLTVTVASSFGIFAFDLNLNGSELRKLTLIVQKQAYCEGLTFQDRAKKTMDLLHAEGVAVSKRGDDLIIEFGPPVVAVFRQGGRLQYVNQFR